MARRRFRAEESALSRGEVFGNFARRTSYKAASALRPTQLYKKQFRQGTRNKDFVSRSLPESSPFRRRGAQKRTHLIARPPTKSRAPKPIKSAESAPPSPKKTSDNKQKHYRQRQKRNVTPQFLNSRNFVKILNLKFVFSYFKFVVFNWNYLDFLWKISKKRRVKIHNVAKPHKN